MDHRGAEPVVADLPEGEWRVIEDSGFRGRIVGRTVALPPHQTLFAEPAEISR